MAVQPEIGSVSAPLTMRGLDRFFTLASSEAYPSRLSTSVNANWTFHKYEDWSTVTVSGESNQKLDMVYAYYECGSESADAKNGTCIRSTADWLAAAGLVQAQQYQALFEGFALHMWQWYSAVLMWKVSSPWPSLRGALYGNDLEPTGGYWGARRAIRGWSDALSRGRAEPLHVQLNPDTLGCAVIDRRGRSSWDGLKVTAEFRDVWGRTVGSAQSRDVNTSSLRTAPSSPRRQATRARDVANISGIPTSSGGGGGEVMSCAGEPFEWPLPPSSSPGATLLVYLSLRGSTKQGSTATDLLSTNFYWLSSSSSAATLPSPYQFTSNYSELGSLRQKHPWVDLSMNGSFSSHAMGSDNSPRIAEAAVAITATVTVTHPGAPTSSNEGDVPVAFWVTLTLLRSGDDVVEEGERGSGIVDERILPSFWDENCFPLLPGESRTVQVTARVAMSQAKPLRAVDVEVSGWNVVRRITQLPTDGG